MRKPKIHLIVAPWLRGDNFGLVVGKTDVYAFIAEHGSETANRRFLKSLGSTIRMYQRQAIAEEAGRRCAA